MRPDVSGPEAHRKTWAFTGRNAEPLEGSEQRSEVI